VNERRKASVEGMLNAIQERLKSAKRIRKGSVRESKRVIKGSRLNIQQFVLSQYQLDCYGTPYQQQSSTVNLR
jgi:hypothetical protein